MQSQEAYRIILERAQKEWYKLEKILLTVVSGTLAVSITFLKVESFPPIAQDCVVMSWLFLFLSLLSLLFSYIFAELSADHKLRTLKKDGVRELTEEEIRKMDTQLFQVIFNKGIDYSNLIAIMSGFVGLSFLAIAGIFYISP